MDKSYSPMVCTKSHGKRRKKLLLGSLLLGAMGALSFSTLFGSRLAPATETFADGETSSTVVNNEEEELLADRLSIRLNSSARTASSHSFNCIISSTRTETITNRSALSNVYAIIKDPEVVGKSIKELFDEAKSEKTTAEAAGLEWEEPHYRGSIFRIANSKASNSDIVIPKTLFYHYFYVDIEEIEEEVCTNKKGTMISYDKITSISIPNTVKTVADNAFPEVPEDVEFRIEEGTERADWATDWTDSENILLDQDFSSIPDRDIHASAAALTYQFGEGEDFLFRKEAADCNEHMEIHYNVVDLQGNLVAADQIKILDPISDLNNYDGVGSNLGSLAFQISLDFRTEIGTMIDPESISFHNIHKVKVVYVPKLDVFGNPVLDKNGNPVNVTDYYPDYEKPSFFVKPAIRFASTISFDDAVTLRQGGIFSYGGYTRVGFYLTAHSEAYKTIKPDGYNLYKQQIDSGSFVVRTTFVDLSNAYYLIYLEGEATPRTYKVTTPISNFLVSDNGESEYGIILEDRLIGEAYSPEGIRKIELCHFTLSLELYRTDTKSTISRTQKTITFAYLPLIETTGGQVKNLNAITVAAFAIFIACYAALAFGYFLYAKKKYRNDEFRRVNNKRFLIAALKNGLGLTIVFGALFFIYARWALFKGSIVTFNPFDIYVIIFSIAGLIYTGFTIKNIANSVKDSRKRKEALRLHLGQDKDDDGTN